MGFSGQTYASQDHNELAGITALATRGANGSPLTISGKALIDSLLDGDKININPFSNTQYSKVAEEIIQAFNENILPAIHSECLLSRCWGSSGHHTMMSKAVELAMKQLADVGEKIYFDDYVESRTKQHNAITKGIEYGMEYVHDQEMLRQAGLLAREYTQGGLEDAFKKWKDEQDAEIKQVEIMGNAIRAMVGAQVTKVEPFYRASPLSQIAGVAMAGMGAYMAYSGYKKTQVPPATGTPLPGGGYANMA